MTQLTISDDLARAIADAGPFVRLVDSTGKPVAEFTPLDAVPKGPVGMTEEHVAELERRMAEDDGTRYVLSDVIARLRKQLPE